MSETQPAVELYQIKVDSPKEGHASLRQWARGAEESWYYSETVGGEESGWNLASAGPPSNAELVDLPKDKLVHDFKIPAGHDLSEFIQTQTSGEPPQTERMLASDPAQAEFDARTEETRRAVYESETERQQAFADLSPRKVEQILTPAEPDRVSAASVIEDVKDQGVPTTAEREREEKQLVDQTKRK